MSSRFKKGMFKVRQDGELVDAGVIVQDVEKEGIINALGYEPADKDEVYSKTVMDEALSNKVETSEFEQMRIDEKQTFREFDERKIDKPADAPQVGKVLKIKSVNADGTFVCEWADAPTPDLTDYVKNTDYATTDVAGAVKTSSGNGFEVSSSGIVRSREFTKEQYDSKQNVVFVSKGTLENVKESLVKSVLTDGESEEWTEDEQDAAKEKLGVETVGVPCFTITEDMVTVETDDTKGEDPYSTSYGYTNIVISADAGIKWVEGALYTFVIDTKMIAPSSNRNVRIKIDGEEVWHPMMQYSTSILSGSSYFIKNMTSVFQYKSVFQKIGALHVMYDANTTYTYLANTVLGDATGSTIRIDNNGYGARYSLVFPTTSLTESVNDERYSSLVSSSGTGATKLVNTGIQRYYIDRHPLYVYSANIAKGAMAANSLYQDYTAMDARYIGNASSTYIAARDKVFLVLYDFDKSDLSFKVPERDSKHTAEFNIVSKSKLQTLFPASTNGDVYLYFLGYNTSSWYTITPSFTQKNELYKYTPSTGELSRLNDQLYPLTDDEQKEARERIGVYSENLMEVIADFEVENDVDKLTINKDVNGKDFKLLSAILIFELPAMPSEYTDRYFTVGFSGVRTDGVTMDRSGADGFFSTTKSYRMLYEFFNSGYPLMFATGDSAWNYGSSTLATLIKPAYEFPPYKYIKSAYLQKYTSSGYNCPPVLAGTRVKLLGVRA